MEREFQANSLYDLSAGFWDNFNTGPRQLSANESRSIAKLAAEVKKLEGSGAGIGVELFGRKVASPIGIAAGPAPNSVWLEFFSALGYDLLTHKTVRDRFWEGHPLPNLLNVQGDFVKGFEVRQDFTGTITNSLGMPSAEPRVWKREVRRVLDRCASKFIVVSVTATVDHRTNEAEVIEQFSSLAGSVKEIGAHAVEMNLSCPNVTAGEGGEIFTDFRLCGRIVDSVRKRVGSAYPILLKSGYLDDYSSLVDETWDPRVAYAVINSIAARVKSADGSLPFTDRGGKAGIAGAALFDLTLRAVKNLERIRKSHGGFKILAVGGVTSPNEAMKLLNSGADIVESATGALFDPSLALRIKKALLEAGGWERQ